MAARPRETRRRPRNRRASARGTNRLATHARQMRGLDAPGRPGPGFSVVAAWRPSPRPAANYSNGPFTHTRLCEWTTAVVAAMRRTGTGDSPPTRKMVRDLAVGLQGSNGLTHIHTDLRLLRLDGHGVRVEPGPIRLAGRRVTVCTDGQGSPADAVARARPRSLWRPGCRRSHRARRCRVRQPAARWARSPSWERSGNE